MGSGRWTDTITVSMMNIRVKTIKARNGEPANFWNISLEWFSQFSSPLLLSSSDREIWLAIVVSNLSESVAVTSTSS
uniref:Dek1 n=1 Tax=Arundo donax TaxID=35708 RepID=A0A0A9CKI4_ARUDO